MNLRTASFVAAISGLLLATPAIPADPAPAERAWALLKTHCSACHGPDGKAKGGFDYVLDRERLVSRLQVLPGRAGDSPLLQRIQQGEMPPGQRPKLTPPEREILARWIEAGAPALPGSTAPPVTPAAVPALILADLQNLEPRQQRFARYLTLTHLASARISADDMQRQRHALAKLVNSLSWHPRLTRPKAVDASETVFRIDLRDYRWTARQWDRLTFNYPYRVEGGETVRKQTALAGCDVPVVRGDWFVVTAGRPPFYHDLLQLPSTDRALERLLGVEVLTNLQEDNAVRAGFNGSGVARSNRVLERHDSVHGAYWRSYDFTDGVGRQNIFEHPLGPGAGSNAFNHAGGELIFHLPNGLQGYMLVDGRGQRVDRAPVEIVSDPKRPDRLVETGVSCFSCHLKGLLPKDDQVRAHVLKNVNAFSAADRAAVRALYVPPARMKTLMTDDIDRYLSAQRKAGVPDAEPEPIEAVTLRYEAVLDLTTAAAEAGLAAQDFAERLRRSPGLTRTLGALLARGGTVQRQLYQESFVELARALQSGSAEAIAAGKPFAGHRGAARALAFAPDGRRIATGGEDGTVRVWDAATGQELRRLEGHREEVTTLVFSKDGHYLLSGGRDRLLRFWDVEGGRQLRVLRGHTDAIRCVTMSVDGKRALTGGNDRSVFVWDLATGEQLAGWVVHDAPVTSIALSPDGQLALSASLDRTMNLREVATGRSRGKWEGHQGAVHALAFAPDGKRVVSGGNDRTVRLWDVATGKELRQLQGHANAVISVAFAPDGKRVLSASSQYQTRDRIIRVWDVESGREVGGRDGDAEERVESLSFSRDGRQAALSDAVRGVRVWKLEPQP